MHICHMIDVLKTGGAQKLLITFGHEAIKSSIQTSIVCLNAESKSDVGHELKAMGLDVTYFYAPHLMDVKRMWNVTRYLRKNHPDVLQTHLRSANIVGGLTGAAVKIPVISTLHSTGMDSHKLKGRAWLEAQIMKRLACRVVAVGDTVAKAHQHRLGNKKIDVIPNAVSLPVQLTTSERSTLRNELVGNGNKTLLVSVGRFSAPKAFGDLIRAYARLRTQFPQSILVLVGDGIQRTELEMLSNSLGLKDSVYIFRKSY
jgi:glycosyltransferase involved in cell wall biosynthesis